VGGQTADFRLRIDHVLRGSSTVGDVRRIKFLYPNWPQDTFDDGQTIASCNVIAASAGDVIAMAFRALAPDGKTRYTAISWISGGPENGEGVETTTLAKLQALADLPQTDTAPESISVTKEAPTPSAERLAMLVLGVGAALLIMGWLRSRQRYWRVTGGRAAVLSALLMLGVAGCSQTPPVPATSSVLASPSDGPTPSAIAGYMGTPIALRDGIDRFAWSTIARAIPLLARWSESAVQLVRDYRDPSKTEEHQQDREQSRQSSRLETAIRLTSKEGSKAVWNLMPHQGDDLQGITSHVLAEGGIALDRAVLCCYRVEIAPLEVGRDQRGSDE
jgi:hypothetical protein